MKVAQIAPPWLAVPPAGYGGIEWVVSLVSDGLARRGHDVTLYAPGGSRTRARLVSPFPEPLGTRMIGEPWHETMHTFAAYADAVGYDVIHDHSGMIGLGIGALSGRTVVHTLHGPFDEHAKRWYRSVSGHAWFVAISEAQRAACPELSYAGTVHNGIDLDRYPFRADKEDFLLFLGRSNHEKGPEVAVEVARRTGVKLVMVVKLAEDPEREHWRSRVEPRLTGEETILGEVSHEEKVDLLGR
ncbi:MAG: glycosyltransferase, partial [Acidobacteria bacterium]|nr:glycosyltransferase [Acidobacteriota bacterium]